MTKISFRRVPLFAAGLLARAAVAVAVVSLSIGARASIVFDSVTGAQQVYSQCLVCPEAPNLVELGDVITLAGTDRTLTNITIGMEQDRTVPSSAYLADVSVGLYSIDGALATTLIATRTSSFQLPSEGLYRLAFNFTGVTVPDTFFVGFSVASASPEVQNLRLSLWDYFDTSVYGDGGTLPVGGDPGTVVNGHEDVGTLMYARMSDDPSKLQVIGRSGWGEDLLLGYTPVVQISAVPEPETPALFLAGGLALCSMSWRLRRQR